MSDGFSLDSLKESAQEASEAIERNTKTLCPWLPDPYECDECGYYCDAEHQYVTGQAKYCKVWQCPNEECGNRYYRERV